VVGTPYKQQEVRIQPSTLHAPSTTSPTSIASLFRFEQSLVLDLNLFSSLRFDFFFAIVIVPATQLMGKFEIQGVLIYLSPWLLQ
jgi:hypothetical protein